MRDARGFSLVELMVAMLVTMIISGAIYGLMAGGQGAFQREPALTERQQNIRLAMSLISEDVIGAEAFQGGTDNVGVTSPGGKADHLWMMSKTNTTCPDVAVNLTTPINGVNINTADPIPSCYPEPGFYLIFYKNGGVKLAWGHNIHSHDDKVNFPGGQQPVGIEADPLDCSINSADKNDCVDANGNDGPTSTPVRLGMGNFVKWQIANDADGVPELWRTETGGYDIASKTLTAAPSAPNWTLVARGIEDMQIRYLLQQNFAAGTWTNQPSATYVNDYGNVVRQVEIVLSARTTAGVRLTGQSTEGGVTAVRGNLRTVIAPRSALVTLAAASPQPVYQ